MDNAPSVLAALGRFHPLVIHFPIGLLAGAACLELWTALRRSIALRPATGVVLGLASVGTFVAAACGVLLAQATGYDGAVLARHRLLGFVTTALAVAALALHRWSGRSRAVWPTVLYRVALAGSLVAVCSAGYYGGIIAHGETTPFASLAAALHDVFATGEAPGDEAPPAIADEELFQKTVAPVLQSRCWGCHGPDRQKSGLRLDSREAALAGGKSGKPAVVPGNAMASRLVQAITLPAGRKGAMPPPGKKRLEPREVVALIDWVNRGASWPDKSELRPDDVAPPSAAVLERLRSQGFLVSALAEGHPLVRVTRVPADARLSALAPIAAQVAWLSLPAFEPRPGELRGLADMPHLTRLDLHGSTVRDDDLADVVRLPHLAVLNLYGTRIGDAGLEHLHAARSLEHLFLWRTNVTDEGVRRLAEALPSVVIERGAAVEDGTQRAARAPL